MKKLKHAQTLIRGFNALILVLFVAKPICLYRIMVAPANSNRIYSDLLTVFIVSQIVLLIFKPKIDQWLKSAARQK